MESSHKGDPPEQFNRGMFKPFRSHGGLLSWYSGCMLEDLHRV